MSIELLHRNRFLPLDDATARQLAANVWEIRIPRGDGVHHRTRRAPQLEAWDGAVFALDGVQTEPATGSGEDASAIRLTVVILD